MAKPTFPIPAAPGFTPPPVAAKKSKRTAAFKPKAPPKPPKPPKVKAPPKPRKPRKPKKPKKKAEPKKKAPETAFLTATVFPSNGVWTLPGQPGRIKLRSAVIQGYEPVNGTYGRGFALRILSGGSPFMASYAEVGGASLDLGVVVEVSFGSSLPSVFLDILTAPNAPQIFTQGGLPSEGVEVTENGGVELTCINYQASDVTPPCVFGYTYTL